jgi:hypothetical protein
LVAAGGYFYDLQTWPQKEREREREKERARKRERSRTVGKGGRGKGGDQKRDVSSLASTQKEEGKGNK